MASPQLKEIADWLEKIWGEFPSKIVRNIFQVCGFVYEENVSYGMETEYESEIDSYGKGDIYNMQFPDL